jgi:hypothetical protein
VRRAQQRTVSDLYDVLYATFIVETRDGERISPGGADRSIVSTSGHEDDRWIDSFKSGDGREYRF